MHASPGSRREFLRTAAATLAAISLYPRAVIADVSDQTKQRLLAALCNATGFLSVKELDVSQPLTATPHCTYAIIPPDAAVTQGEGGKTYTPAVVAFVTDPPALAVLRHAKADGVRAPVEGWGLNRFRPGEVQGQFSSLESPLGGVVFSQRQGPDGDHPTPPPTGMTLADPTKPYPATVWGWGNDPFSREADGFDSSLLEEIEWAGTGKDPVGQIVLRVRQRILPGTPALALNEKGTPVLMGVFAMTGEGRVLYPVHALRAQLAKAGLVRDPLCKSNPDGSVATPRFIPPALPKEPPRRPRLPPPRTPPLRLTRDTLLA